MKRGVKLSTCFTTSYVFLSLVLFLWSSPAFPACPGNLADVINTPTFGYQISYTNDNTDGDFISDTDAQNAANSFDPAHQAFTNLGFLAPFFNSNPEEVCIFDSSNVGGANFCQISLDSPFLGGQTEPCIRLVSNHELFHHVEYAYINNGSTGCGGCSGTWGQWTCEGMARMMQDKLWNDLDQDAGCITYLAEINDYLASPNTTLTSASYKAALFWAYLAEQLGATPGEPQLGSDVIAAYWANTDPTSPDSFQVLRDTVGDFTTRSLEDVFHDFTIVNYTRELNVLGLANAARYFYVDESPAGGGSTYNPVARTVKTFSNTLSSSSVNQWAARYFEVDVDPGQRCDIMGFRGEAVSEDVDLGWTFIGIKASNLVTELHKGVGSSFFKAFINEPDDPFVKLAAVVTGLDESSSFDYTFARSGLSSGNVEILRPTVTRQSYVGEHTDPDRFLVRMNVLGPAVLTPDGTGTISVKGLSADRFTVFVENDSVSREAEILSAAYVGGQYWLTVQAPVMDPSDGTLFNVRVCVCEASGDCLATALSFNSVIYAKIVRNQMLVVDRSGSMGLPSATPKIDAAKTAAALFVDAAAEDDLLGVASFSGNLTECNDDSTLNHTLQTVAGQRLNAQLAIGGISQGGWTSIGDGLIRAQNQLDALGSPAPGSLDYILLLSDGMENEARCWQASSSCSLAGCGPAVKTVFDIGGTASNTIVDSIAFGPQTDQALMQDIATTTDGDYFYVDVSGLSGASVSALAAPSGLLIGNRLSEVYLAAGDKVMGKDRIFFASGNVAGGMTETVIMPVTEGDVLNATVAVNWEHPALVSDARLFDPTGSLVGPADASIFTTNTHKVYQFKAPLMMGNWRVELVGKGATQYILALSGKLRFGVRAALYFGQIPQDFFGLFGSRFQAGLPVTILVSLTDVKGAVRTAEVEAVVSNPDGTDTLVPLFDDGQHDDGDSGDGIYGNVYTRTGDSSSMGVPEEEAEKNPGVSGSYVVFVTARGKSNLGEEFTRVVNRAFQVYEFIQEVNPDRDKDGLPDRWEKLYGTILGLFDRDADYDNDGLINIEEFRLGTDPLNPDTDGGGVMDGSEMRTGTNPLDPRDDRLPRPVDVEVVTSLGCEDPRSLLKPSTNVIRFPANPAYARVILLRGTTPEKLAPIAEFDPRTLPNPGIFFDEKLQNGVTYYYRIQAVGEKEQMGTLSPLFSGTPQEDPFAPKGWVNINGGVLTTVTPNVVLTLDTDPDNVEVLISNAPTFAGSKWIPNPGKVEWVLEPDRAAQRGTVYALFRDKTGNESSPYNDSIIVDPDGDLDDDGIPDDRDNCLQVSNPGQEDQDKDGAGDACDNCILVANGPLIPDPGGNSQRDTDLDGYGNICDPDLDNNGAVGIPDFGVFRESFGSSANFNADFDGNGVVGISDFGIFRRLFGKPPGPSGLVGQNN